MKREIKFRGYSRIQKEWGYGSIVLINDRADLYGKSYFMKVDKNTIGQYIDKNDIDNKEIYEGDICDITFRLRDNKDLQYSDIFLIKWDSQSSSFVLTNKILNSNISISYVEFSYIKILGNIYENPELLKEDINENY